jgi:hypothetical protein
MFASVFSPVHCHNVIGNAPIARRYGDLTPSDSSATSSHFDPEQHPLGEYRVRSVFFPIRALRQRPPDSVYCGASLGRKCDNKNPINLLNSITFL